MTEGGGGGGGRGVRQDHVQQLLLTLHSFHYGIFQRKETHGCFSILNSSVFKLYAKYKLYTCRNCTSCAQLRPGVFMANYSFSLVR